MWSKKNTLKIMTALWKESKGLEKNLLFMENFFFPDKKLFKNNFFFLYYRCYNQQQQQILLGFLVLCVRFCCLNVGGYNICEECPLKAKQKEKTTLWFHIDVNQE